MATHAQHNANHFAKSSDHLADYNENDYRHPAHGFCSSLGSDTNHAQEPLRVHVERVVRQYFAMLGDETPTDLYELILKQIEEPLLSVVLEKLEAIKPNVRKFLVLIAVLYAKNSKLTT